VQFLFFLNRLTAASGIRFCHQTNVLEGRFRLDERRARRSFAAFESTETSIRDAVRRSRHQRTSRMHYDLRTYDLRTLIVDWLANELQAQPTDIPTDARFSDLGMSRMQLTALVTHLEKHLTVTLPVSTVRDHPTVALLAQYLSSVASRK
jgi:acyl carrier protein